MTELTWSESCCLFNRGDEVWLLRESPDEASRVVGYLRADVTASDFMLSVNGERVVDGRLRPGGRQTINHLKKLAIRLLTV